MNFRLQTDPERKRFAADFSEKKAELIRRLCESSVFILSFDFIFQPYGIFSVCGSTGKAVLSAGTHHRDKSRSTNRGTHPISGVSRKDTVLFLKPSVSKTIISFSPCFKNGAGRYAVFCGPTLQ